MAACGLMAFWATIDDDYRERYRRWHNCEHIPERVSTPGFLIGRRYQSLANPRRFLMCYETEGSDVLTSAPYLAKLNAPTPWTREALPHFGQPVRAVFSIVHTTGQERHIFAPGLLVIRLDLGSPKDIEILKLWADRLAGQAMVRRVRVWTADDAGSNAATSEKSIHGSTPGEQRWLVWIELGESIDGPDELIGEADALTPELVSQRRNVEIAAWWLDYALDGELVKEIDR